MAERGNRIAATEALALLSAPGLAGLPELAGVADLARRAMSRPGCATCRQRRVRPEWLAPSVGAGLIRAIRAGRGPILYRALAEKYSMTGPIQLEIGPCRAVLTGEKDVVRPPA